MNIGRQWEDRLKIWAEQFEKHYVIKHAAVPVCFFTTMEQLPLEQVRRMPFQPAPVGTRWGQKWEYGWFRASVTVPQELSGKRLVLFLKTGPEMLVWVNGALAGAIDLRHDSITLTRCATAGETFEIYAECYAGHGVRNEGAGPVAFGEQTVPEPPSSQVTVGESYLGVWNETVFQAAMDYQVLYSLVKKLPPKSLRAMKIIEGLKAFTIMADFELPPDRLTQSVAEADRVLQPLLACRNGSTAPEYTVFGQSHLDMAWLWPVEETMRKSARTYANQLALMEEYGEYRFLMCEPPIVEYLKTLYPDVYRRVREKTAQGAFVPEGAMWIEADTNIPSGESLIRQFTRGKRWFRDQLGVESRLAWMPDTFGFSAALPQIMRKCQVPYFATQKLLRQDPEAEPFPYNVFWWEGLDGSRVLSHIFKKNNARFDSGDLITRWEDDRIQQENIDGLMYPFGYGDGGGGPTREMLEMARRCADLEGAPRCRMENPVCFLQRQHNVENVYCGELYLAWHRGTWTAQSRTKRGIRKAETALRQVEYQLARWMLAGKTIPDAWKQRLDECWKLLLFNQFHDVAAGVSIARVHERAERELEQVLHECHALLEAMLGSGAEAVYNDLPWPVMYRGREIPAQSCVRLQKPRHDAPRATVRKTENGYELCNRHLICLIAPDGELLSVRKPGSDMEYLNGRGNRLLMYKDVNTCYDAWEMGSMYEQLPVALEDTATLSVCEDEEGAAVVVKRRVHHSLMEQKILLGHDARRIDFITSLDWQERHKLLKVAFPVNVYATEALHEIQFGYLRRPTHRSARYDRDRYEVCNQRYTAIGDGAHGAAVLNDCKYGVSTAGSEIRLTLMRAPLMPDMTADQGLQQFTYAFYPFEGPFAQSGVVREAVQLNQPPVLGAYVPQEEPLCLMDAPNIVVDTIKPADTAEHALLVRAYEAAGMQTQTFMRLHPSVSRVLETDMLEQNARALEMARPVSFGAFEIKTLLLYV
ncbi:MAG: glycoside hydrolase family 38 C-terminal domain-containing protein [Clostridia bacterium]|nr:glycoside hydrolase family 38 C-terminal domain-containing protein [Clostridia bacterium]MDD6041206.1 glycoside hydrolase family 38 C-terminal domain-containing protein [Clostridia bacterium]